MLDNKLRATPSPNGARRRYAVVAGGVVEERGIQSLRGGAPTRRISAAKRA
jgi:hypothetical protein